MEEYLTEHIKKVIANEKRNERAHMLRSKAIPDTKNRIPGVNMHNCTNCLVVTLEDQLAELDIPINGKIVITIEVVE